MRVADDLLPRRGPRPRYDGAIAATLSGVLDRLRDRAPPLALEPGDRLEGRTCLVTGANRGLGLAIAVELARLGGHVVLACRSGIPEVMEVVRRESGAAGTIEAVHLDLSSLASVERVVDELAEDGVTLDVTVLNAGIVPSYARRTRDGFEESFQVNFLANVLLVARLLERGVIPAQPSEPADDDRPRACPRVLFVSSESHRSAPPIDLATLGQFRTYGMSEAVAEYGASKLLIETYASELARRLRGRSGTPDVAVHTLCPGAVRTDIGREAPSWAKPALDLVMRAFFKEPSAGAHPAIYLAASRAIEGRTGLYLHVNTIKPRAPGADDPSTGCALMATAERLLDHAGHPVSGVSASSGDSAGSGHSGSSGLSSISASLEPAREDR